MDKAVLLDTSAWIAGFRKGLRPAVKDYLERQLSEKKVVTTQLVILEILAGARDQKEFNHLYEDFGALACVEITVDIWQAAYKIIFNLRQRGYTIPAADVIIAAICLKHNYLLVHSDRHYETLKNYYPLETKHIK